MAENEIVSTPAAGGTPDAASSNARRFALVLMRNALPVGFVGLIVLFVLLKAPNFLTFGNFSDILRLSSPITVVAIPMAFLLILGYVDLSVGSAVALNAVIMGLLITDWGVTAPLAVAATLVAGALIGGLNGFLVTKVGLAPVIVTLGTLTGIRGVAMWIAPQPVYGFGEDFAAIGYTGLAGIPYFVMIAAAVIAIGGFVLGFSPLGRHVLAIGVNEEAAFLSGINTKRTLFVTYVATGIAAALAGVMYGVLLNSAPSGTLGIGFELDVLTAVMLGGVAFNGGRGTIRGVVLGVLFLAILQNGLTLLNVQAAVASVIKGAALVLAASLDRATLKAMFAVKTR
jgi:ribose/xylose/arabinose/galactoside ABC-type transport system permease subunit